MSDTAKKNYQKSIEAVLTNYIGTRKSREIAEKIYNFAQQETQYMYKGQLIFVHEVEDGNPLLTEDSVMKMNVAGLLSHNLEADDVEECLNWLFGKRHCTGCETIINIEPIYVMRRHIDKPRLKDILEEFVGSRKVPKLTEVIVEVLQKEKRTTFNGTEIFIRDDAMGKPKLAKFSLIENQLEEILKQHIKSDDLQECIGKLIGCITDSQIQMSFEPICVEGSDSKIYDELLRPSTPVESFSEFLTNLQDVKTGVKLLREPIIASKRRKNFIKDLQKALSTEINPFKVPVCDLSLDDKGNPQFVIGGKPAVKLALYQVDGLATKSEMRHGSKEEYTLFLAKMIILMMDEGRTKNEAIDAVVNDSTEIGHYKNSSNSERNLEATGSRMIAGKCDLANTSKLLKGNSWEDAYIAGGHCNVNGYEVPLSTIIHREECRREYFRHTVGWLVF